MRPRVYLAGPIGRLTYDEATTWRNAARDYLDRFAIDGYSPMRAKDFLKAEHIMPSQGNMSTHPLATNKGIMTRDYNDCIKADALLVNFLGVERVSLGTAMEMAWAFDRRIPVVVVAEPDNININHPMAAETVNYRVSSLAEGLALIKTILLPGGT